jgi:regulator of protease activity HflC (stomatin/prohibitin superfamily)
MLGGAMLALAFPLLLAERIVAAQSAARLPEAPELRALLFLPVLCWPAAGLLQIAASLGARYTVGLGDALALLIALVGIELVLRALGVLFLPPPEPEAARAATTSLLARLLARGARGGGLAAPIREQFGIDFSRSWALLFVRAALPPVTLLLLLCAWGLSGIVLVPLDQRAVYQRFGAPAGVLHPGLHAILPWPLGSVRRVDLGIVHTLPLVAADLAAPPGRIAAEDVPPSSVDRLWEQPHPGEAEFLIASAAGGRQSFQSVSADVRVLWRVGLDDAAANDVAYRTLTPEALLRGATGRVCAAFFAGRTLDAVLGENREAMAERLREGVQAELDRFGTGVQVLAVVLEAIHPPAGAADAYHNVQAAEISANATVSAERGRAAAARAGALQYANELTAGGSAAAAETTGAATADATRFAADHAAAVHGGPSFLLERYFASLVAALGRSRLTLLDNRIEAPDAPVLDLRPPGAGSVPAGPSATE